MWHLSFVAICRVWCLGKLFVIKVCISGFKIVNKQVKVFILEAYLLMTMSNLSLREKGVQSLREVFYM